MAQFNREEGEAICDIPLSRRQVSDSVYWKYNKDGIFTVKSACKVARALLKKVDWAESSSGSGGCRVWAAIWKLWIPNKIKVFGWRVCHDILPTRRTSRRNGFCWMNYVHYVAYSRNQLFMLYGNAQQHRMFGMVV